MGCGKVVKYFVDPIGSSIAGALGINSPFDYAFSGPWQYGSMIKSDWRRFKHLLTPDMREDRENNTNNATEARRIVYGRTRVGGQLAYAESTGSKKQYLHLIIVVASHEIDRWDEIWLGDELGATVSDGVVTVSEKFSGHAKFWLYDGTQTAACPQMVSASAGIWTDYHIIKGCAYIHARLKYSEGCFPGGMPEIKAVIRGKRVYDPRTGLTAWSDNPILCIRDYMRLSESRGGMGCDESEINQERIITMANVCDERVDVDDTTTEPRYTLNGIVTLDGTPASLVRTMLTSCAGDAIYRGAQWHLYAGASSDPVATIDESWLNGGITFTTGPDKNDRLNICRAKYTAANDHWADTEAPTYPVGNAPPNATYWGDPLNPSMDEYDEDNEYDRGDWVISAGIAYQAITDVNDDIAYKPPNSSYWYAPPTYSPDEDYAAGAMVQRAGLVYESTQMVPIGNAYYIADKEELSGDLTLPYTTSGTMAQRLAKIMVEKSRLGGAVAYPCNLKAFTIDVFDVVLVNNNLLGWSGKMMRVMSWQFSPLGGVVLNLVGHDPHIWDASVDDIVASAPATTLVLPDPSSVSAMTGLTVTESQVTQGSITLSRVAFSWTSGDDMVIRWIVTIDGTEWATVTTAQYVFSSLSVGSHVFGVIPINDAGVRGPLATLTYTVTTQSGGLVPATSSGDASASTVSVTSADADATYGAEEQSLINEMKSDINTLVSDLNAAVGSINDLKAKLRTAGYLST